MNRFLATTAVLALCGTWLVTGPAAADDTAAPAASAAPQQSMKEALNEQLQNAQTLRQQGKFEEASRALGQMMLVAPDDARIVGEYGKTLTQMGRSQDAVSFLTRAVQMQSNDWTFYSALGVAYDQLDKRTQAREAYDRALALKPGEPSVLNNYAVSRMLAGDYAGAQKMLQQIQATGTNDPKVAGNITKLAELEAANPSKSAAAVTTKPNANVPTPAHSPVSVAASATPTSQAGVLMQKVPVDPLAGPVGKAYLMHAPVALAAAAPKPEVKTPVAPSTAVASVQPKIDPSNVIMQKVPADPLAGPVAPRQANGAPHALANAKATPIKTVPHSATAAATPTAAKPKAVLAKAVGPSAAPALRTASDTN